MLSQSVRFYFASRFRYFWSSRSYWGRVLFCLLIGLFLFFTDNSQQIDTRLQLRGTIAESPEIVVITFTPEEWKKYSLQPTEVNRIRSTKELDALTDAFFWNESFWATVLQNILVQKPRAVGITLYFAKNVADHVADETLFSDSRVLWAAKKSDDGVISMPLTAAIGAHYGVFQPHVDNDGVTRSFDETENISFAQKLSGQKHLLKNSALNFQANFKVITLTQLFNEKIPLQNKIVLLGAATNQHAITTPVGKMLRVEFVGHMVDNYLYQRTIHQMPKITYLFFLVTLLFFTIWIIYSYPQPAALTILFVTQLALIALSVLLFDSYYFYLPVQAPLAQTLITVFVFISYRLTTHENKAWQLKQEQKAQQELELLKSNFISLFSHDLKTPIAKIQAVVDRRLSQPVLDEELEQDLQSLRESNVSLNKYIQSILRLARVEAKDFQLQKDAVDINQVVEAVLKETHKLAVEKNVKLIKSLDPMFSIECDAALIHEVILNFVDNAIKYTPKGGQVTLSTKEVDDEVWVMVEDSGDGIDSDELDKIWDKFYRLKKHDGQTKGTGLGLYLAKYFIELHGGKVFVKSNVGKGTQIGFRLPVNG